MAEPAKSKVEVPWGTLLPLIAALAGVLAHYQPLVSSRPPAPGEKSIEAVAEEDVDARLWQDPLVAAENQFEAHEREQPNVQEPISPEASHAPRHNLDALANLIKSKTLGLQDQHQILLLAVMIDSGPYVEQGESRLRSRRAVLEGLSRSGFAPKDSEHIGFISTDWPLEKPDGKLLIPWEECQPADQTEASRTRMDAVVVLWLPASSFNPFPLTRFGALLDKITQRTDREKHGDGTAANLNLVLIGPTNSDGLRNMIQDATTRQKNPNSGTKNLNGLSIISARASIPDNELLGNSSQSVQAIIQGAGQDLHFLRSVTPDDIVLRRLIEELRERDVGGNDKIVILTEWDSTYGRALGRIFASCISHDKAKPWPPNLYLYQYLRGIDGRLPGERIQTPSEQEQRQKNRNEPQAKTEETTEGTDQSDFLRRLARKLKDDDLNSRRTGAGRIRAIGLLGADIYDKLMILRALRPEFPEAIFFTNNYDAHFERHEDWRDVRNLVIASPFGGKLPTVSSKKFGRKEQEDWQGTVTPFRDNNQTSMYLATLIATQRLHDASTLHKLTNHVSIFEIGRQGAYDLNNLKERYWFHNWLKSYPNKLYLIGAVLSAIVLAIWIRHGVIPARFQSARTVLARVLCDTLGWVVCGSVAIILLVCSYAQSKRVTEPLEFRSGISIWPTEMLRLIALLLTVHFMMQAFVMLKLNCQEISDRFSLKDPPVKAFFQKFRLGFTSWRKAYNKWAESKNEISAQDAWNTLLYHNAFWPRLVRVSILVTLYLIFTELLRHLFFSGRQAFVPARGEKAFYLSYYVLTAVTIAFTVLCFYVIDAIQLNANFIRVLTKGFTKWPDPARLPGRRDSVLSDKEISPYNDVLLVKDRTKAVAQLIWYPLIVIAILLVARSSFFDNWTWPPVLVVAYSLNVLLAMGSAVLLRQVAEKLRTVSIEKLQVLRSANYRNRLKRDAFSDVIDEIRNLKTGAFAPITDQPFIRAILLPGAALGLLSVAQRLLEDY